MRATRLALDVRWLAGDPERVAAVSREPSERDILSIVCVFGAQVPDFLVREKMMVAQVSAVGHVQSRRGPCCDEGGVRPECL